MRSRTTAVIGLIAAATSCRDGPTVLTPVDEAANGSRIHSSIVLGEPLDAIRRELRGPFVQSIARSHLDPGLAEDLRHLFPEVRANGGIDPARDAEFILQQLSGRVGMRRPGAITTRGGGSAQLPDADSDIARDALLLILGDALGRVSAHQSQQRREVPASIHQQHD